MNKIKIPFCLFVLLFMVITTTKAQILAAKEKIYTKADSLRGGHHLYRTAFNVHYYDLNLKVNPRKHRISGTVETHFVFLKKTSKIQIDLAKQFHVQSVKMKSIDTNKEFDVQYVRDGNFIFIPTTEHYKLNQKYICTITYKGKPRIAKNAPWDGGFIWKKDSDGYPWVSVACQGLGGSIWWPMKDDLADEPDSLRIAVEVPKGLENISNGRRIDEVHNKSTSTYTYFVSNPINTYNVTINVGKFKHFSDSMKSITGENLTLNYYVKPENVDKAKKQFQQVKPMIKCFENAYGPYPFINDGYQIIETPYLGMEHQSAIAYGNKYRNGYLGRASSTPGMKFDFIIIHETGHEWWGNNVSSSDIADMWIHEAFTTYAEVVYVECMFGEKEKLVYLRSQRERILNDKPLVGIYGLNVGGSKDMYNKGSLILYTFSQLIGEDNWNELMRKIQIEFGKKTIDYQQLISFINKEVKKDYTWFFDQYLKKAKLPVLKYSIKDKKGGKQTVTLEWTHCNDSFAMPVYVKIGSKYKWIDVYTDSREVTIDSKDPIAFINDIFCYDKQDVTKL